MNGVEILAEKTIYETAFPWWPVFIFAGVGLIIGIIMAFVSYRNYKFFDPANFVIIFVCMIVGASFGTMGAVMLEYETDTIDHIEYKVTIDDSVSINEFLDKYEILDQEGKIYTVKEKE